MKTKTAIFFILLVFMAVSSFGQHYIPQKPDTLVISEPGLKLEIPLVNIGRQTHTGQAAMALTQFWKDFPKVVAQYDLSDYRYEYQYDSAGSSRLLPYQEHRPSHYQFSSEGDSVQLLESWCPVVLYIGNELVALVSIDPAVKIDWSVVPDFQQLLVQMRSAVKEEKGWKRNPIKYSIPMEVGKLNLDKARLDRKNSCASLSLNLGAGVALMRNDWAPELSVELDLSRRNKRGNDVQYFVSLNNYYFFEERSESGWKTHTNSFLNLGARVVLRDAKDKSRKAAYGIYAGLLMDRSGDYFDKDTFKLGLEIRGKSGIAIRPEVYFEEDFKMAFPVIGIGFGF